MRKDNINYNKILRFFEIPKRGPTSSEIESINRWVRDYGFEEDMIARAAEITLERTGSPNFRYADAILRDWKNKGYHNVSDIPEREKVRQKTGSKELPDSILQELKNLNKKVDRIIELIENK